jgi:hypothetical protein
VPPATTSRCRHRRSWSGVRAAGEGLDQYFLTNLLNHIQAAINTVNHSKALSLCVLSRDK